MSLLFAALLATQLSATSGPSWSELEPGISYAELKVLSDKVRPQGTLHAFRVDLRTHRLVPIDARTETRKRATVSTLAQESAAPLIINGTYFDERARPLGLLIGQGHTYNVLRRADWGVFYVKEGKASLVHTTEWKKKPIEAPEFAIQVGPRCVIKRNPVKLKPQVARRAALGIQGDGRVVIVVSSNELLSADLARSMATPELEGGLGCTDAVMLDGGGSAQLWATLGERRWRISGAWPVPNAVAVKRR